MRALTLSSFLFLAAVSTATAGPFEDGLAAYKTGDWDAAYRLLKPVADSNTSQTPVAQERMGRMTERGKGTTKDFAAAAKWYEKAANQGDVLAQGHLGRLYRIGAPGLARDPLQAAKWSIKAATQGNALAQASLGHMALEGVGGPADPAAAAGWFKRAADQGDANAMLGLGTLQEAGKGVPKDVVQAAKWYALASIDDGESDDDLFARAKRQHETLAKSMSPAQIASSDQLVKDFKPVAKR
jgi:TPR repeat protein